MKLNSNFNLKNVLCKISIKTNQNLASMLLAECHFFQQDLDGASSLTFTQSSTPSHASQLLLLEFSLWAGRPLV